MKQHLYLLAILPILPLAFQFPATQPGILTIKLKVPTKLLSSNDSSSGEDITIEQYSRCLSPYEEKQSIKKEERQYSIVDVKPRWQRALGTPKILSIAMCAFCYLVEVVVTDLLFHFFLNAILLI